jgi:hypothetical protein
MEQVTEQGTDWNLRMKMPDRTGLYGVEMPWRESARRRGREEQEEEEEEEEKETETEEFIRILV